MKDKRRELVPLIWRRGANARIADCTHFLLEYPSVLAPMWIALKVLLRFEWIKIIQDGSLPARYKEFSPIRKALFRLAVQYATEFIVVSDDLEGWLRKEIRVKQKISLIKNLLPVPYRATSEPLPEGHRRALTAYQNSSKRVCSIGVFIPSYGFEHVARAVELLRKETGIDIGLLLLDGDFATEQSYRREVLDGRDWITVLKNLPRPLVFGMLSRSDVFVRAVEAEGYGLSRVEAIWSGLPAVATRAGETRGMLLFDFGNVDELVIQLRKALFGPPMADGEKWAAMYQAEAEQNLQELANRLGI
jgi:glycosyltransferase involved in cell wall biosynthesis